MFTLVPPARRLPNVGSVGQELGRRLAVCMLGSRYMCSANMGVGTPRTWCRPPPSLTPCLDGLGYWLVAGGGGGFAYGDAGF